MTYQEFITIYTQKLLKKKDRDLIFETLKNQEFINNFYKSQEYKNSKEKHLPLFSYILMNSFKEAKPFFDKELINFHQIIPCIVYNKDINSVKKLNHFHQLTQDDLPLIFSKINEHKSNELFIDRIIQNNLYFAVDFFDKFKSFFNDEQYLHIDKYIKLAMINTLNMNNGTRLKEETNLILQKYPFFDLNDRSYKDGTYELLRLSITYNFDLYNYFTFINESKKIKLKADHIIELFDYLFFKKDKHSGYNNSDIGNAQFYTFLTDHIEKDTFIPNFLNILNNLSENHRYFKYDYYLPPMLKHFDHKSFMSVDTGRLDKDANVLHNMLENDILPETSTATKIHYVRNALNDSRRESMLDFKPAYKPKNILIVLKTLSKEDIYKHVDINSIFSFNHTFYYRKISNPTYFDNYQKEQQKILLNDSHKIIDYLIKNKFYPNTQPHFINQNNFSSININAINDKIILNKLKKIEDKTMYFFNFIEAVLNKEDVSFYIHKKDFIDDFYKNKDEVLISSFFKYGLSPKAKEYFDINTKPFFEQYEIRKALKESNLVEMNHSAPTRKRI